MQTRFDLTVPFAFERRPSEPYLPAPNGQAAPDRWRFAVSSQSDAPHPSLAFAPDDLFRFTGADGATQTVSLRAKDIQLDPGTLDLASAFGQRNLADDVTVDRLMLPGAFEAESVSTLYAGAKGTWFRSPGSAR